MVSVFLRSLLYNVVFYLNLAFWVLLGLPTYAMPRWGIVWIATNWGKTSIWWMRIICNTKVEYRGLDKIPKGSLIAASKHQSTWETFALLQFFDQPLYILKRELLWLPLFGWYLSKAGMIGVNRKAGGRTLIDITKRASEEIRRGRQLLIFPEGTRRAVDAPPDYKNGVSLIYGEAGVPCIPVALNSGLFWPRRTFMRYPGTLVIEFLDPIPPGLKRHEFTARMQAAIEEATDRLVKAGREEQVRLIGFSAPVATSIRS
ncbi:MAG: lysophospholipid acyltransferase family protein [Pseudomonadota bacterium]